MLCRPPAPLPPVTCELGGPRALAATCAAGCGSVCRSSQPSTRGPPATAVSTATSPTCAARRWAAASHCLLRPQRLQPHTAGPCWALLGPGCAQPASGRCLRRSCRPVSALQHQPLQAASLPLDGAEGGAACLALPDVCARILLSATSWSPASTRVIIHHRCSCSSSAGAAAPGRSATRRTPLCAARRPPSAPTSTSGTGSASLGRPPGRPPAAAR